MALIGTLGQTVFEVSDRRALGFETLEHTAEARIATQEIIGREPVTEFLGPGSEEVSFDLRLSAQLGVDPRVEFGRLDSARSKGTAMTLIIGGVPIGGSKARWLIKGLRASHRFFSRDGKTTWLDVNVGLTKYVMAMPGS